MTILESIFLGLIQGFTEFLPVSSSGHLMLAQKLFGIDAGLFFDVMLHVGTLLAVVIALRKSLWQTIRHPVRDKKFLYLVIASIPTFALALLVKLFVPESAMAIVLPIGFALTAVLIVLSEKLTKPRLRLDETNFVPALVTGITQGLAVFPGLSRSGTTISTMKFFGVNASDAAEFSFLLSIPVILASAVVELWEALHAAIAVQWYVVLIGVAAAFVSGLVSVWTVMRAVKNKSWIWFAVYLIVPFVLSLIVL
ncbi:MAG: undecaprenyl-diphosphate phosphatase [Corallococcus sp.]|nr:undecaprenyl-diphosphate phosphatase [Corallococcus sp.]MCM1359027.1 undecaprenyl-diphosphate phosphatase [Corallococcus sp.]MCM1395016.1 undecaprenyl-diphosphate phosphatase [Corallococcus sp.]